MYKPQRLGKVFLIGLFGLLLVGLGVFFSDSIMSPNGGEEFRPQTEYKKYVEPTERALAVKTKYEERFWRVPNVHSVGVGFIKDKRGNRTREIGIIVSVTDITPLKEIPQEHRLPNSIEGISIQVIEEEPHIPW